MKGWRYITEVLKPVYRNGILMNDMTFDEVRDGTRMNF